jgi:uncharacterized repeat protein (TIGR03803 family)
VRSRARRDRLLQATDGKLHGTTEGGGTSGLVQATNGHLYGTTEQGGTSGEGSVFRLCVGMGRGIVGIPCPKSFSSVNAVGS